MSWLRPTELDRARLVASGRRARGANRLALAAVGLATLAAVPAAGVAAVVPLAACGALVALGGRLPGRPELRVAAAFLVCETAIAAIAALTGGSASAALAWLAIPVLAVAMRLPPRALVPAAALAGALAIAVTVGGDPASAAAQPLLLLGPLALIGAVAAFGAAMAREELERRSEAGVDPLTGALNRRALEGRLAELTAQARNGEEPVSLLICDIDGFKRVNDTHGHERGDAVLREVAESMRRRLRSFELLYRVGGEEFVVVLPAVGPAAAMQIAERLRRAIRDARAGGVDVTASFGVAAASGSAPNFGALLRAADAALYDAKRRGRDCVAAAVPAAPVQERRSRRRAAAA